MSGLLKSGYGLGGRFDRAFNDQLTPLSQSGTDEYGMELALIHSMNSIGISPPNPPVGCVIMKNGEVLSQGFTQTYKKEHAERMAWKALPPDTNLNGAIAYVTLEPCAHVGFQPACVDLILSSDISKVVVGTMDPDPRVSGEGIRQLKEAGKEVVVGVLQNEVRAWLFPFLRANEKKSPVWIAKWAQTKSGYLADADGNSKWISNERSRAYTHWLRQKYDAIVVGAQTFISDSPKLTARDCVGPIPRQPDRFVVDPRAKIIRAGVDYSGFKLLVCESELKNFEGDLSSVIQISGSPDDAALGIRIKAALESAPRGRPLQSVMVEGGARLINILFKEEIFDAAHVFVGSKEFENNNSPYLIQWVHPEPWFCASEERFDKDYLREWVKGSLMSESKH